MQIDIFKKYNIVAVENKDTHFFFKRFFKNIYVAKSNQETLPLCKKYSIFIVFLYCNNETIDTIQTIKALKRYRHNIIIVVVSYLKSSAKLLNLLSLGITAHFDATQKQRKTKKILENIYNALEHLDGNMIFLSHDYYFDKQHHILYDKEVKEIKLSKKERILLTLFIENINKNISVTSLEYHLGLMTITRRIVTIGSKT